MPTIFDPTMLFGSRPSPRATPPATTPFDNMSTAEMRQREQDLLRRLSPNFQAITGQSLASSLPGTPPSGTEQQLLGRLSPSFQAITGRSLAATMPGTPSPGPMPPTSPRIQGPPIPQPGDNLLAPVIPGSAALGPLEPVPAPFAGRRIQIGDAVATSQPSDVYVRNGPLDIPSGAANVVPSGANVMDMPNLSDTYGGAPPGMSFMAAPNPQVSGNFTNQLFANASGTGAPGMWNEITFSPPPVSARFLQEQAQKAAMDIEKLRSSSESADRALDRQTQLEIARMQRGQLSPEAMIELDAALRPEITANNPNAPQSRIDELVRDAINQRVRQYSPQQPGVGGAGGTGGTGGAPQRGGNVISDISNINISTHTTPQAALAAIMRSNPAAGEFINSNWDAVRRELTNKYGQGAMDTFLRGSIMEGIGNPLFVMPGQNPTMEQQIISAARNREGGPQYGARPGESGIGALGRLVGLSSPFGLLHPLNPISPLNRFMPFGNANAGGRR